MDTLKHTPLDCTDEQRANLAKLAAYLRGNADKVRPHFDMSTFRTVSHREEGEDENGYLIAEQELNPSDLVPGTLFGDCNSVGCAIGHGPEAGIDPGKAPTWGDYGRVRFGVQGTTYPSQMAWVWMFAGTWYDCDNSPEGAAARIEYALAHGVPLNAYDQLHGNAPLCYTI